MRRIAQFLRKLADLIDPSIKPSTDGLVVTLTLNTDQFTAGLAEIEARLKLLGDKFAPFI